MAAFLNDQLDFIFFFYGLAFILLGATCWFATSKGAGRTWAILGGFGFLHGLSEWLDLTALIVGDSAAFAAARMAVMAASYFLLLDFARVEAIRLGLKLPGRWIYVILALAIVLVAIAKGTATSGIVVRYTVGFVGALASGVVIAWHARNFSGGSRGFALSVSVGFILYAIAAGLIVPVGHFWPSSVLNYNTFTDLTQMPIQLVRGLLACWISFSVWAVWSQRIASDIASPRYTAYVHEQFTWTLVIMGAILVSGWTLTQYLGGIYRENVEREARTDIDMLASRLSGDVSTVEAMVQSLAGSPSVLPLLTQGSVVERQRGQSMLELDVEASGAGRGHILDRTGTVVASSVHREILPGAESFGTAPDFLAAIQGKPTGSFSCLPDLDACDYSASYPIQSSQGEIVGVAVLTRSLASFEADLRGFERPYFFIDPDGVIEMTNRSEALHRTLWPLSAEKRQAVVRRFGRPDDHPMLERAIVDASWMTVDGERSYVRRRFVDDSGWSLVILKPPHQIFATRLLGIVITLLVTIMALIYLLGRARRVHDEVQRDNRQQLQELAQDLGVKATTDALTGLHNRLKLEAVMASEIQRAGRYETPLTIVMFDIDHFKTVNDTFGHTAGDEVLVRLSGFVSGFIRNSDLLVRWGGEEFLILMPGVDGMMGCQAAEKCREAIEHLPLGQVGTLTCSFGVAQYAPGETGAEFMARADAALYRAKAGGRNQVRLAPAPGDPGKGRHAFAA